MKNIVIVGAGGFGREVFNHAEDCIRVGADWKIKGFIDDNLKALDNYDYPQKVIGTIKEYIPEENDFFICAIGSPKTKKIVVGALLQRGAKFEKLIHPSVKIGRNVKIERNNELLQKIGDLSNKIDIEDKQIEDELKDSLSYLKIKLEMANGGSLTPDIFFNRLQSSLKNGSKIERNEELIAYQTIKDELNISKK